MGCGDSCGNGDSNAGSRDFSRSRNGYPGINQRTGIKTGQFRTMVKGPAPQISLASDIQWHWGDAYTYRNLSALVVINIWQTFSTCRSTVRTWHIGLQRNHRQLHQYL